MACKHSGFGALFLAMTLVPQGWARRRPATIPAPLARPGLPERTWTPKYYPVLRTAERAVEPRAQPGPGRPPWRHPGRRGAAVLEVGDGAYWVIGGRDSRQSPTNRTWVFRPEPFERKLRPPERHPGGFWTEGPRMHCARAYASAALLADGRILVSGGYDLDGRPQRRAEIINPTSGRCRLVGSMRVPRAGAPAVRLRSGRILVVGGYRRPEEPTATLETFDPGLEEFVRHPWRLEEAVAFPATVRLNDGDVLITGGWTGSRPSEQMLLFDDIGGPFFPGRGANRHHFARGSLRRVGAMAGPRAGHRMRRMGEVVLIAGGTHGEPCHGAAPADPPEVWDTARPGPESAFEPVGPLDARFPRRLPYASGKSEYEVSSGHPDCTSTPSLPPVDSGVCWIFPRNARGPWDGRGPAKEFALAEPRDRTWPFSGTSRDSRPPCPPPGYPELPLVPRNQEAP